jgi:hypothetical protein
LDGRLMTLLSKKNIPAKLKEMKTGLCNLIDKCGRIL